MTDSNPVVFFSRCKPQGLDALKIALESRRIFFGYPLKRPDVPYDRHALRTCLVDPSCSTKEWEVARVLIPDKQPQYRRNHNFVSKIAVGSIALIPRPAAGVIHCGRVDAEFELVNDPPWYNAWERIWLNHNHGEDPNNSRYCLAGEVAQTWRIDQFIAVPVPRIPAWIRRSLFGRSTYGIVPVEGDDPYRVMSDILHNPKFPHRVWTTDPDEIASRLKTDLVPGSFEHLVVSLLQLEFPKEVWTQVGGSGDGGVDGIGGNENGDVIGLLQCKWAYKGGDLDWPDLWVGAERGRRRYVATLIHPHDVTTAKSSIFLGLSDIVRLVLKHADRLPIALSLRIGAI